MTFDIRYDITRDTSLLLMVGIPPKPTITGEATIASLAGLGKVHYRPTTLNAFYRFRNREAFRPYVGLGATYLSFFKDYDATFSRLSVPDTWGFVLEAGAEYQLSQKCGLFFDVKEMWVPADAYQLPGGAVAIGHRVRLDSSLVSAGIRFHIY
jgi:outer membrane protein